MKLWALFKEEFAPKADDADGDGDDAKAARACLIALSLSVAASRPPPAAVRGLSHMTSALRGEGKLAQKQMKVLKPFFWLASV